MFSLATTSYFSCYRQDTLPSISQVYSLHPAYPKVLSLKLCLNPEDNILPDVLSCGLYFTLSPPQI